MIFSSTGFKGRQSSTIRILLMLVLFVGVGYLFWKNYERSMETIQSRHIVNDETETLDSDLQKEIVSFSGNLQRRFGIGVQVRIFRGFIVSPGDDSRMIFIGLSPAHQESTILFPPILKRALPQEVVHHLQVEHFEAYWEDGDWQQGLIEALNTIGQEMMKIERGE
ncbi:hypothetical protein [Desulfonatronovibrio hydrogenovorans]|uniref:hypothetical protein n=1 Tax=Desulfonatronovibrio hydrogenovorans TaxID=53245 RepID=UPI00048DAEDE|nr:hypothetical protein [Desulfonatronovibrio hydrogenovorans]